MALRILSNLTNGLEMFYTKEEKGFVLGLATSFLVASFLEAVLALSWFNYLAIVFKMTFV